MKTTRTKEQRRDPFAAAQARLQRLMQGLDAAAKQALHTQTYGHYCAMQHTTKQGNATHAKEAIDAWEASVREALQQGLPVGEEA